MTENRFDDGTGAVERRDEAQRRLSSIRSACLAGSLALTATVAGLAYMTAPGRTASAATVPSSADGSSASGVTGQDGGEGLQAPDQAPAFGGFGYGSHAVSGGS